MTASKLCLVCFPRDPLTAQLSRREVRARTIKRHWTSILRWFDAKIPNGLIEGINSLVQAAKAKARGCRPARNLKAIVYLFAGKLDLPSPFNSALPTQNSEEPKSYITGPISSAGHRPLLSVPHHHPKLN